MSRYTIGFLFLGSSVFGAIHHTLKGQTHLAAICGIVLVLTVVKLIAYTLDR